MRKHRKLLLILIGLAVLVGLVPLLTKPKEPHYQGRSLSKWLMIAYESDRPNADRDAVRAQRALAAAAIRAIGTNALPHLLTWLRYEPPVWHNSLARALPHRIGNSQMARTTLYRGAHRAEAARAAFAFLGTNAAPAIPELASLARDDSHPVAAARAILTTTYLGSQGFEAMKTSLADNGHPYRYKILWCMAFNGAQFVGTNTCLATVNAAMNDPDPRVRSAGTNAVLLLTGKPLPASGLH